MYMFVHMELLLATVKMHQCPVISHQIDSGFERRRGVRQDCQAGLLLRLIQTDQLHAQVGLSLAVLVPGVHFNNQFLP
jgi:hypothetical protein